MQDLASPHARNVAGSVNDTGQKMIAPTLWNNMISLVICDVSGERLYNFNNTGNARYVSKIVTAMHP